MMCGILGFAGTIPNNTELNWSVALATIRHRGPDSTGSCVAKIGEPCKLFFDAPQLDATFSGGPAIAFGHQRLSIIDLSQASNQPMFRDGLALVYNGEIYNYIELRQELKALGHSFHSEGDTEVLLAAYQQWGRECVHKLRGMFAFALYNANSHSLWLARDRFAIKPLFVTIGLGFLAFASEAKALIELLGQTPVSNDLALYHLIANRTYGFGRQSFYSGIDQLLAGEDWLVDLDRLQIDKRKYYSLPHLASNLVQLPDGDATCDYYREVFDEAIKIHLRADVPVGICFSGGLDSSSLLGTVTRNHLDDLHANNGKLNTFTAVFDDRDANEQKYATAMLKYVGISGHTTSPAFPELAAKLAEINYLHDGPISTASILVQYSVMELAKSHGVKVLLDGQGGDEALGGYPISILLYIASLFKRNPLKAISTMLGVLAYGDPSVKPLLWSYFRRGGKRSGQGLLSAALNPDRFASFSSLPHPVQHTTNPQVMRYQQLQVFPIPGLCKNEDRNSMAFSLESRVPLLDHVLVETALRLSPEMLFKHGLAKYILRRSMKGRAPKELLWRRTKLGFAAPEQRWIGKMSFKDFHSSLISEKRLASVFAANPSLISESTWPQLSLRERFLLLSIDAWLGTSVEH